MLITNGWLSAKTYQHREDNMLAQKNKVCYDFINLHLNIRYMSLLKKLENEVQTYNELTQNTLDDFKVLQEIKADAIKAWECDHDWEYFSGGGEHYDWGMNVCSKCELDDEALDRIERSIELYPSMLDTYAERDMI